MKKLILTVIGITTLSSPFSHAGFADTMRDLRSTLGQISATTKELGALRADSSQVSSNSNSSLSAGQWLHPKINNLALYQSPSKSAPVLGKLQKNTDIIFQAIVTVAD